MSLREAAEMALDCLLYYNRREAYPRPESPTSKTIKALRAALAEAEAPKAEPVAWYHPSGEGYDSAFRDHRTVMACTGGDWSEWIPLYTHPPEPVAWTPVTTRRPPWDERKVVCYTEGYDYGGSQFITMPASDFHCYDEDDPDEPGSRESKTVSHWIYEDDLIRAVLAHGRKG